MFFQFGDDVPVKLSVSFLDVLNLDFLNHFFEFLCVCHFSFCVQEDCDVNKYFYGKVPHLLNAYLV